MASLSSQLLAVLDAVPASNYQTLSSQYQKWIIQNTDSFNSLSKPIKNWTEDRVINTVKAFDILFGDQVIISSQDSYEQESSMNWSKTCWLPAACIVKLSNSIEVALALKVMSFFQCQFAVRSGGHNSNPGCASIGPFGVLLDLSLMNQTFVDEGGEVASVGPGARWGSVYEELEKHQLTVVGGRAADVGVGGFFTGGGMSHFSNHRGMAADNVRNFEVVLADSRIINVNIKENADLFRALKGGGPNFGILTRFDLQTYTDLHVWYTFRLYNPSDIEAVTKSAVEVQEAMKTDDHIGFFLSIGANSLGAGMLYKGKPTELPSAFQAFDAISPMTIAVPPTQGTQLSAARTFNSMNDKLKRETGVVSVRVDAELYVELQKKLKTILEDQPFQGEGKLLFIIQPINEQAVEKGNMQGGNAINIPAESQSWLAMMVEWADDVDDDNARAKIRRLVSEVEDYTRSRGLLLEYKFMNDAGYFQSPLKSYGKEMVQYLQDQSRKWDPNGIFQKLQNGGYLLSELY